MRGEKAAPEGQAKAEILHQGIAARAFERRFQLADHVQVTGARLEHGLLHIDLVREIPEAKKPRLIPIGKAGSSTLIEPRARRRPPDGLRFQRRFETAGAAPERAAFFCHAPARLP